MKQMMIYLMVALVVFTACNQPETKPTANDYKIVLPDSLKGTFWDHTLTTDERIDDLLSKLTLEEKIDQMIHGTPAVERLGIPEYNWWNEALHGVARFGRATIFPQPIGMAATFDEELIERVATVISDEGRAKFEAAVENNNRTQYAGLTFWSPNVNIFRDPRWGRGMETWGEDPYLTSILGSSFVRGLQGNHPDYLKAAACAKHYVVHSGPEGDRHHFNATPPIKDFYETYLPAFEALVRDAKVEAIMCAYNRTYDEPCCGSPFLLQEILRQKWGFEGHILSDCWAINDFHTGHHVTQTQAQSAALALKSGVSLNCGSAYEALGEAVEQGLVTEEEIDEQLAILFRTRFKLGLFNYKEQSPFSGINKDVVNAPEHVELAREVAAKSVVMLKNNGVLPLDKNIKSLNVIGPNAANVDAMIGNYHGVSGNVVTIKEGITNHIGLGVRMEYRHGFQLDKDNENKIGWAISEAQAADAVIVVMGINTLIEGEEGEAIASTFKSDRVDIKLPPHQLEYLKKIRENEGKPLIVVLTGGSPLAIPEVHELADAVLFAWYPGEQGGNGVADVIFGDVNPSARLPITFPYSVDDLPPYDDYSMVGRTYRYMEKEPLYPFGYGLSYTSFEYGNIKLSNNSIAKGDSVVVTADITNTGKMAGEEVVQLYITDVEASARTPLQSLKGIKKVYLNPGETKQVSFTIGTDMLALITEEGETVLEPGGFKIILSGSAPVKRSQDLGINAPVETMLNLL